MILVAGVTVLSQHRLSIRLALGLLGGLCGFVVAAVVGTDPRPALVDAIRAALDVPQIRLVEAPTPFDPSQWASAGRQAGADVVGSAALIELTFLGGRSRIHVPFDALLAYDD
jgi:hypothetical protein